MVRQGDDQERDRATRKLVAYFKRRSAELRDNVVANRNLLVSLGGLRRNAGRGQDGLEG